MSINKNFVLSLLLATNYCNCLPASKASAKPTEADIMRTKLEKEIKQLEALLQEHIDYFEAIREGCDTLTPSEFQYGQSLHDQLDAAKKAYAALNK